MLLLTKATDSIQLYVNTIDINGTPEIHAQASFVDLNLINRLQRPGRGNNLITSNGTIPFVLAEGTTNVVRAIKQLTIYNNKLETTYIEIRHIADNVNTIIFATNLGYGQNIQYTTKQGFKTQALVDDSGFKVQTDTNFTPGTTNIGVFTDANTLEKITLDEFKAILQLSNIITNTNGDLELQSGNLDLNGGEIINGTINSGIVT